MGNASREIGGCGAEPESWADGWDKAIDAAINELEKMPAADVQEVKHGKWKNNTFTKTIMCDQCRRNIYQADVRFVEMFYSFCPYCGAKMDGKDGKQNDI